MTPKEVTEWTDRFNGLINEVSEKTSIQLPKDGPDTTSDIRARTLTIGLLLAHLEQTTLELTWPEHRRIFAINTAAAMHAIYTFYESCNQMLCAEIQRSK